MNDIFYVNWNNINNIDNNISKSLNNLNLLKNNFNKEDLRYLKVLSKINKICIDVKKYFYYYFQLYLYIYINCNNLHICDKKFKFDKNLECFFNDIKLIALSKKTVLIFNNMNIINKDNLYSLSKYCINNDNESEKIKYYLILKLYGIFSIEIIDYIFSFENKLNYIYI